MISGIRDGKDSRRPQSLCRRLWAAISVLLLAGIAHVAGLKAQVPQNSLRTLTTAREAHARGYKVVFGSDSNATDDPEIHDAELKTLRRGFALVLRTDQIMDALEGKGAFAAEGRTAHGAK